MKLLVSTLLMLTTSVAAFSGVSHGRRATAISGTTKQAPLVPDSPRDSYGEVSRQYRRTVYSHEDWVRHRASDRFIRNLQNMLVSGVYKNLGREVVATTAVATIVCLFNNLAGGYTDFSGVAHEAVLSGLPLLGLPLVPFTLSSSSLGLLLGTSRPRPGRPCLVV